MNAKLQSIPKALHRIPLHKIHFNKTPRPVKFVPVIINQKHPGKLPVVGSVFSALSFWLITGLILHKVTYHTVSGYRRKVDKIEAKLEHRVDDPVKAATKHAKEVKEEISDTLEKVGNGKPKKGSGMGSSSGTSTTAGSAI